MGMGNPLLLEKGVPRMELLGKLAIFLYELRIADSGLWIWYTIVLACMCESLRDLCCDSLSGKLSCISFALDLQEATF